MKTLQAKKDQLYFTVDQAVVRLQLQSILLNTLLLLI
jgi:hypothetical protein